ncbi:hypothetical protein Csa_013851 [Cucumis sativus]|uniref:Uncharacterized protein n=1 Tax=Cucumis sativus TaxID=3659 RepID=A0A0A0LQS1_CUCSA|nr:hypothetical protein Csa_013851 [Cucumis sativus]
MASVWRNLMRIDRAKEASVRQCRVRNIYKHIKPDHESAGQHRDKHARLEAKSQGSGIR